MDVKFLFGWAKENGIELPRNGDGNINIPASFELYNEWKKKGGGASAESERNDIDNGRGKSESNVVELDDNSELARLITSSDKNKYETIRRYLIENFGGRELELSDGKKAIIDNKDAKELTHKANDKRIAELSEIKNLVKRAKFIKQTGQIEHRKFIAFRYYEVKTLYKGETRGVVINVGIEKSNYKLHLYALTNRPSVDK